MVFLKISQPSASTALAERDLSFEETMDVDTSTNAAQILDDSSMDIDAPDSDTSNNLNTHGSAF